MNSRGYLAFSYVDIVSWVLFILITAFVYSAFYTLIDEPKQMDAATLSLEEMTTLRTVMDYPLDTGLFREVLTEQIERVGPASAQSYDSIKSHITEILGKDNRKLDWTMVITDSTGTQQLTAINEKAFYESSLIKNASVFLPTNRADYPVIKVTLFLEEKHE